MITSDKEIITIEDNRQQLRKNILDSFKMYYYNLYLIKDYNMNELPSLTRLKTMVDKVIDTWLTLGI